MEQYKVRARLMMIIDDEFLADSKEDAARQMENSLKNLRDDLPPYIGFVQKIDITTVKEENK